MKFIDSMRSFNNLLPKLNDNLYKELHENECEDLKLA